MVELRRLAKKQARKVPKNTAVEALRKPVVRLAKKVAH